MPLAARLQRSRDDLLIVAALALLAAALALGGWAWRLDRVVYDLGLSLWSRPAPAEIVIVAIDDASVDAIGRWPWRRAVHATLLEKIAQARPKAVALDLVLSESDPDPAQDALLAQALQHAAPVVLPLAWQSASAQALVAMQPAPPLRAAVRLGAAEAAVDADGVLRHGFLQAGPAGALVPNVALALLQAGGETLHPKVHAERDLGDERSHPAVPGWRRDGRLLIRFVGPPGTVKRVSYADVLSGATPPSALQGRYVLVGMTALGLGDTLATPVNGSHQAMPGVEVLANLLYTLRSGDTLEPVAEPVVATLSIMLLALLLWAFSRFGARRALPLALVSAPLAVAASLLALRQGLWCSPVPYVLPALLAYPLWSWRRLERVVAGLDHEIQRLAAEPWVASAQAVAEAAPPGSADPHDPIDSRLRTLQGAGTAMRQARRFLADALAAMPTAMLVADAQARVLMANPRAAALFDVADAQEMHGLDLVALLAEFKTGQAVDWRLAISTLVPGGAGLAVEGRLADRGDNLVHLASAMAEGALRLIVTVADIAPVKEAQREREQTLAFVSHDLRSPASSIVMLADLHLQGHPVMPLPQLLQEMRRLAQRTLALSEDFVRAAQVQTRALQLTPTPLQALMDEALADHRAAALSAQVRLALQVEPGAAEVTLDRLLVARAVGNLVSNAIKHSAADAVVQVHAVRDQAGLLVQVRDHGPGLSAVQLSQLNDSGQHEAGAEVRDARGVGLGLVFVQRVARRHGGVLRAALTPPAPGALFELQLPVV
jgi:CHASE2 domain-containing sensor protein/signal transduction histidine kinase